MAKHYVVISRKLLKTAEWNILFQVVSMAAARRDQRKNVQEL
jgi:hypothetical protein